MSVTFRTTIVAGSGTTAGIVVPDNVVNALGAGKKPTVTVTLDGFAYRSSIASMGGQFMIGVSSAVRAESGLAAGQEVEVVLEVDTAPRVIAVPEDLAAAAGGGAGGPGVLRQALLLQQAPPRGAHRRRQDPGNPGAAHRKVGGGVQGREGLGGPFLPLLRGG